VYNILDVIFVAKANHYSFQHHHKK